MKTTGIVRRIDNLGRVIIPKAIRKELNIKDESMVEIFIEKDSDGKDYVCFSLAEEL